MFFREINHEFQEILIVILKYYSDTDLIENIDFNNDFFIGIEIN